MTNDSLPPSIERLNATRSVEQLTQVALSLNHGWAGSGIERLPNRQPSWRLDHDELTTLSIKKLREV